jgi:cell division protein FtsQ
LPLVVGQGADSVVSEALDLYDLAERYQTRLRGFVRVGGRRWDIVFDDLRILLPEAEPDGALVRIAEIDVASLLMDRDVIVIDARDPDSLTLRLGDAARELQERTGDGPGEET